MGYKCLLDYAATTGTVYIMGIVSSDRFFTKPLLVLTVPVLTVPVLAVKMVFDRNTHTFPADIIRVKQGHSAQAAILRDFVSGYLSALINTEQN